MFRLFKSSTKRIYSPLNSIIHKHLPRAQHSNMNSPLSEEDSWKIFPMIPFFNGNVKLGLFLGIPGILSMAVPSNLAFDYMGLGLAALSLATDSKHFKDPQNEFSIFGLKVNTRFITLASVLNSAFFTLGMLGEFYMLSTIFSTACYLGLMGGYKIITQYLSPAQVTENKIRLLGAAISTIGAGFMTDLNFLIPNMAMDPTLYTIPLYFVGTYLASGPILKIYKEACKRLALDPELGQVDVHMSKFLVLFKWINFVAFVVFLGLMNYAKTPGTSLIEEPNPFANLQNFNHPSMRNHPPIGNHPHVGNDWSKKNN